MRRSYKIALAAVSCALAVIAVVAQAYVSAASIAINVIAALAISLPLTQKSVGGAVFSYVASGVICFLIVNVKALPFILFYAPYSIIQYALDFVFYKKVRLPKWCKIAMITVFKLGFFSAAFYGCLTLMKIVIADIDLFGVDWTLPLFMLVGLACFCVYDPLYRLVFVNMGRIVTKYVGGDRRSRTSVGGDDVKSEAKIEKVEGDVFDGFGENGGRKDTDGENDDKDEASAPENVDGKEKEKRV